MSFKETYNIDGKQAEATLKALEAAQKRLGETTDGTTKRLSAEDKAARRLAEAADPMKRFNRQHEELVPLLEKGKISFEEAAAASGRYHRQLEMAGKTQEATFGKKAVSQLASYAAGFASLQTGVSVVTSIFAKIREEAAAAAERIKASLDGIGELQQIEDFLGNDAFVKELRKRGVVKDASTGAALANNLDQAGFNQQEQEFIAFKLVRERFLNAQDGSEVATKFAKVRDLLQIDGLENTINKIVQAGGSSSASNPEVAEAVTKYGGTMKALGYDADEILAMMENADKQSPNVDAAAMRLKSLGSQLGKRGLNKGSFLDTINAIRAREQGGENIYKILGEENAVIAYRFYDEQREQGAFSKQRGMVGSAFQRDVLGQNMREGLMKDPKYAAAVNAQAAKGTLEVEVEERTGELALLYQEMRDARSLYNVQNSGRFAATLGDWGFGLPAAVAGERWAMQMAMQTEFAAGNRGDGGAYSKDFEERVLSYLERTANGVESQPKPSAE